MICIIIVIRLIIINMCNRLTLL